MATSYTTTIKNLKPQGWSRQTVADGQALNNSFLEPTHQKDLKLAEGLDATNDRIDSVNTQMTSLGQRVSNAESTVANIGEEVQSYSQEIAQLNSNLQIISAAEGDLATSLGTVTEKLNEHKNLVTVDSTTIAGDGSSNNPYTVIGGGGGGGVSKVYVPNVDGGNLSYTLSAASAAESQIGPWDIKGPKGNDGAKGNDATPLTAATTTIAGGTQVTISYTSGGDPLAQFNVLSGASGQNGIDGISPTVVTAAIPVSEQFPAGGTEVTITDSDGPHIFNISNGQDGQGATVNLLGGEGIEVNKTGANYTISVSADYSGAAVASAKNWVNAQGYVLSGALNPENSISGKWRNGQYYDFGLKASAENALAAVDRKMSYDAYSEISKTLINNGLGLSANYDAENLSWGIGIAISGITANKQYAWTTTGWEEITGGSSFTGVETDTTTLSGTGLTNSPIGITKTKNDNWDSAYEVSEAYKVASGNFATSAGLDQDTQYAMTTNGWEEITGGSSFTGAETNNWISGDGTSNKPIGLSAEAASAIETMADPYQIDGTQYVSVVPDPTTHKVTIGLDNAAANNITRVNANADIWDNASAVSAKSYASINNQQVITTVNQGVSASLSAVQYVPNTAFQGAAPKLMFVVEDDNDLLAKVNGGACSGKGALFFVCSAIG